MAICDLMSELAHYGCLLLGSSLPSVYLWVAFVAAKTVYLRGHVERSMTGRMSNCDGII